MWHAATNNVSRFCNVFFSDLITSSSFCIYEQSHVSQHYFVNTSWVLCCGTIPTWVWEDLSTYFLLMWYYISIIVCEALFSHAFCRIVEAKVYQFEWCRLQVMSPNFVFSSHSGGLSPSVSSSGTPSPGDSSPVITIHDGGTAANSKVHDIPTLQVKGDKDGGNYQFSLLFLPAFKFSVYTLKCYLCTSEFFWWYIAEINWTPRPEKRCARSHPAWY